MPSSTQTPRITTTLDQLLQGKSLLGNAPGIKRVTSITDMNPIPNSRQLVVKGLAQGTKLYPLTMNIFDVDYSNTKDADHPLNVKLKNGTSMYAAQIPVNGTRVQIRCSCFSSDTLIPLADDSMAQISDLVGLEEFFVYAYDITKQKTVVARAHTAKMTGSDVPVYRIILSNGKGIIVTEDHPFLLSNGSFKFTIDLKPEDKLQGDDETLNILNIEPYGNSDVYCFTVDKHANYLLEAGVFVHNCPDFYYRWSYYNNRDKALAGPPMPPYIRKTATRPSVNPLKVEGACKHIISLTDRLIAAKILV